MNTIKTLIPKKDFEQLAKEVDFYCISIYLQLNNDNTQPNSRDVLIKNYNQLKKMLMKERIEGQRVANYLNPIQQLIDENYIWNSNAKGLAIFVNEKKSTHFLMYETVENVIFLTSTFYLIPLFQKVSKEEIKLDFEKVNTCVSDKKIVTNRIDKIVPLAFEGKIETLYVSSESGIYGLYDYDNKTILIDKEKNATSMSLINLTAIKTYLNNGYVYVINPENMPVKGISLQAIIK